MVNIRKSIVFAFATLACLHLYTVEVFSRKVAKRVEVKVNFDKPVGDMYPMWAWFGYDEPNYT